MKTFYAVIVLFACFSGDKKPDNWSLKKKTQNIEIFTRGVENSTFKEFKASSVFTTTFEEILTELYEAPEYNDKCNYNTSYLIPGLSSKEERYFYYKEKLPWPLKDRDVVTKLSLKEKDDAHILLEINAVSRILPEQSKVIRIKQLSGHWLLEKQSNGAIKATQQIFMNPGGRVPSFIVNSLIVKGPLKTFSTLKKALQK